jgi:hypothetical protein
MKRWLMILFVVCLSGEVAQAADLTPTQDIGITGDLVKSPDISTAHDPFAQTDPVTGRSRKPKPEEGAAMMRQQQQGLTLREIQAYQQNQAAAAAAAATPTTIEIPAGTISGINSAITVTTGQ